MSENDRLKRVIDLGLQLSEIAWQRAEGLLRDVSRPSGPSAEQIQAVATTLLEVGRNGTERLIELISKEVEATIAELGLASREEVARLEERVVELEAALAQAELTSMTSSATKAGAAKRAAAKKVAQSTVAAEQVAAKKAVRRAEKSSAKKAAAKRADSKKVGAPRRESPPTT